MGLWSTLEGTVSVHKKKHISVEEAVMLFTNQHTREYCLNVNKYSENKKGVLSMQLYIRIAADSLDAAKFFNKLTEHLKSIGCQTELEANIPYWV